MQAEAWADVRGRGGEYQEREKLGVVKGGGGVKMTICKNFLCNLQNF